MRHVMNILDYYDTDSSIPFLGFGAKLPPYFNVTSHCFAANGNIFEPEEHGLNGLLGAYSKCVSAVRFHGPSAFAPLIRFVTKIATFEEVTQQSQHYHILVIITNGLINDYDATVDAVVEASECPLSIVIIGLGDGDFEKMEKLDADEKPLVSSKGKKMARDIVQFVPYDKFHKKLPELAKEVLAEIPKQVKDFFEQRGIVPKDYKTRQSKGSIINRDMELLKKKKRVEKQRIVAPFFVKIRGEFERDIEKLGFKRDDIQMVINAGLHSLDRNIAVDQLSLLQANPHMFEERRGEIDRKARMEEEEKKRKQIANEFLNKFDDERDRFLYELPLLAPKDFKPLKKHRPLCKICYENDIDTVILECGESAFCCECSGYLKETCPLCGKRIQKIVKIYYYEKYTKKVRQL